MNQHLNEALVYVIFAILSLACLLFYFRVASAFGVIDKPNQRSSHSIPTVRGGGIIFILAIVTWCFMNGGVYPFFVAGAVLIAGISFADDLGEQPASLRFGIHVMAFLLLAWQVELFSINGWMVMVIFILAIGTVNAFNFMDGINGITGVYALVSLLTFLVINRQIVSYTNEQLIIMVLMAVGVFLFFNFRKKARCFAGDVGSVTLAFLLIFLLLQLILKTGHYGWIIMFLVYGVDAVVTIMYRLRRKENIFSAHRSHLYQYLANEMKWPHRLVSAFYGMVQLAINIILIKFLIHEPIWITGVILGAMGISYVVIRERVLHKIGLKGFFARNQHT